VREQLASFGFKTKDAGASWGTLQEGGEE